MSETVKRGSTSLAVKAGFWYVISNFLLKGISFITIPIFSRLMSTEDYGEFSNYTSWQATLLIIVGAELYNTLSRAYYDYKEEYDQYVSSVTIANCLLAFLFYIVFLLGRKWIFQAVTIPEQYVHILFLTLMCTSCKAIYMMRERTMYRYKTVALVSATATVVPTIISAIIVIFVDTSVRLPARIYGFYIPAAFIGIACAVQLIAGGRTFKFEHCKYAFKLSLPLMVHYLSVTLLTSSNTIMTKRVLGAEVTAQVSMVISVIHMLTILFQSLSGAVTTWLMDNLEQKKEAVIRRNLLIYLGGLAFAACGVIAFAPELVWVLGGAKYAGAVQLVPGMVIGVTISAFTSVFTIILTYDKNVAKTAVYTTIVSIATIVMQGLLLPKFGIKVLPYISIMTFGILFVINYILVRKAGYASVINMKGILGILFLAVGVMVCAYSLYDHLIIRYSIISIVAALTLIIAYRHREVVIKLMKSRRKKK